MYGSVWEVLLDLTVGFRPDKPSISRKHVDYTSPTEHKRLASPTLNVLRTQYPKTLATQYTVKYPLCTLRVTCLPGSCGSARRPSSYSPQERSKFEVRFCAIVVKILCQTIVGPGPSELPS